jgi:hypothetical protein
MHWLILWALSPSFWQNEGFPCYPIHLIPNLTLVDLFLFSKLKIAMKGMRFEAVSLIQQTVMKELKAIWEEAFLGHSIHCMSNVNIAQKWAGIILSDGINKYFLSFLCVFTASVWELHCHTVYNFVQEGQGGSVGSLHQSHPPYLF